MANDTNQTTRLSDTEALLAYVRDIQGAKVEQIVRGNDEAVQAIALPRGMTLQSVKGLLDEYLPTPERRKGTTNLADVQSFIDYVVRQKRAESVVYAEPGDRPRMVAVLDHNPAGPEGTGWGYDRAAYAFPLSPEWIAWKKAHGELVSQTDFAFFMEERAIDLVDPGALNSDHSALVLAGRLGVALSTPAEVVAASRGLKIRAEVKVSESVTLETGESELIFVEKHAGEGGERLRVPSAFLIAIPVFRGEPRDVMLVRLRYRRTQEQRIAWCVSLHGADDALLVAFTATVDRVRAGTGLQVLLGSPADPR